MKWGYLEMFDSTTYNDWGVTVISVSVVVGGLSLGQKYLSPAGYLQTFDIFIKEKFRYRIGEVLIKHN